MTGIINEEIKVLPHIEKSWMPATIHYKETLGTFSYDLTPIKIYELKTKPQNMCRVWMLCSKTPKKEN
jgi:hypothetical protein